MFLVAALKMDSVLVVLLLIHSACSIPITDFFPFNGPKLCLFDTVTMLVHKNNVVGSDGVPIKDVTSQDCEEFRLSPNNDGSSPNINIKLNFPFFSRQFSNLYVSTIVQCYSNVLHACCIIMVKRYL